MPSQGVVVLRLDPAVGTPSSSPAGGLPGATCRDLSHQRLLPRQNRVWNKHALLKCHG